MTLLAKLKDRSYKSVENLILPEALPWVSIVCAVTGELLKGSTLGEGSWGFCSCTFRRYCRA